MNNEYLIRYIDYYNDNTCECMINARNYEEAVDRFKRSQYKYWRIIEVILVRENY